MPDSEDSQPRRLAQVRPIETASTQGSQDPVARLETALSQLEAKIASSDGVSGILEWMRQVEDVVNSTSTHDLEQTRSEIRSLIDELLEINAHVQNIARLKQLLS